MDMNKNYLKRYAYLPLTAFMAYVLADLIYSLIKDSIYVQAYSRLLAFVLLWLLLNCISLLLPKEQVIIPEEAKKKFASYYGITVKELDSYLSKGMSLEKISKEVKKQGKIKK